ncbi:MAG: TM0996/MTH895 family glutaredoxin-like protein [Elusimicrobia bacterium]|nr:TM0996/MTH895 family glutaredoxin-like protein [Elusimicrobiota bacterium]
MKKIQVLGTGCPKCKKLTEAAEQAAQAMGIEYTLEKVTNIEKIINFGVMSTPALAVDGVVKVSGRVPALEELKTLLGS